MEPTSRPSPAAEAAASAGTVGTAEDRVDLAQQQQRLDADRRRFLDEQAAREADWQSRCEAAWQRIRHETAKLAGQKQLVLRLRRHSDTEIEISRRQLEASWNQLHREQRDWRERCAQEEAALRDQLQKFEGERQQFRDLQEAWQQQREAFENSRLIRLEEVTGLETRIGNYCAKLTELRQEVARLEVAIDLPAPNEILPVSPPPAAIIAPVSLPRGPVDVLAFLTVTAQDLVDQSQHLLDMHRQLYVLRDSWRTEWDHALAALSQAEDDQRRRDRSLSAHEQELERREMKVRMLAADLTKKQQECQCWEARLARRHLAMQTERNRLASAVRIQVAAAAEQRKMLIRLQQSWEERRRIEVEQQRDSCAGREAARQDYLRHRHALRQRLLELSDRERELEERSFVLTVAQHQLIANDPNPAAAQKEWQRRLDHLQRMVRRPLRGLERYECDLDRRAEQLENFRRQLLANQTELFALEAAIEEKRTTLDTDQLNMANERLRWQSELVVLTQDRSRLLQQVHELEQQLERLSLMVLENHRPETAAKLAA